MRKSVFVFHPLSTVICIVLACLINIPLLTSQCSSGTIEGTIYLDKDLSGTQSASESGESGIFVRVYSTTGELISQTISSNDGSYAIPSLKDGDKYMVAFEIPNSYYLSTTNPNVGSDVQFVTSPNCNVNLGVLDNNSNCTEDSEIILTCFANSLAPGFDDQETIIGLTHNFDGSSNVRVYANHGETGPIWGLGFNDNNQMIYSSAFVKQHTQLTQYGHDAIFITDVSNNPQTRLFAKLSDLGQPVGELDYTDPNDCNYGRQVGTIGIGALSFNDTKDRVFVANLFNNTIVKIDALNPLASTTEAFNVPNPGCSNADYRLFALEHFESALYVGITCTGETSGLESDVSFHIYRFDFETENFTLEFSTDYSKGVWVTEATGTKNNQQWLTDIDFTEDGNMLLGISDRFGHVYCNGLTSRVDDQKGDILIVENLNGTWVLESNGQTSTLQGSGMNNGQGPGGGEFFGDDFFISDPEDHPDIALGSLFVMPGTDEVVTAVFDPVINTYSGGLHRYSTTNGSKLAAQELYSNNITNFFGKATGFGNITSRCGSLLPEVGNLVWSDDNCDGYQSAGESGLAGVTVNMYDDNCNLIATTVTNDEGRYSFSSTNVDRDNDGLSDGMIVDEVYYITLDPSTFVQPNQSFIINDVYYSLTDVNPTEQVNSDALAQPTSCSTNDLSLIPTIKFVASSGVNTGLDIGMKASTNFDLALTKRQVSTKDVKENDVISFEIKVYNQGGIVATEYEITDYLTPAFEFSISDNPGWTKTGNKIKKVISTDLPPARNHTEILKLKLKTSTNIDDYVNYAEISYAKNQYGELADDVDSTPDDSNNNDKGGYPETPTDDLYTDNGDVDEDDHDPARVAVLDLALRNVIQDNRKYDVGDMATFEMTVINQGNVTTSEFELTNLFPPEMTFDSALNDGWIIDNPGKVKFTYSRDFEPGDRETFFIKLIVNDNYDFNDILNLAEISRIVSAEPDITRDVDSTPNDFLQDDKGGDPYNNTDNLVSDDGSIDEDDHDPAILSVRLIDLALQKTTNSLIYNPGDLAEFQITIYNQGEVPVGEVRIVDYLPEYTTLADNTWSVDPNDPSGKTVYKDLEFIAGFNANDSHTEFITLKIDENVLSGYVINNAEIARVIDRNGVDVSGQDLDSEPDSELFNDNGGVFSSSTDDVITDDGSIDEDDHDPSGFYIADARLTNTCNCLSNASNIFNGQFIDSLVITAPSGQTWFIDTVFNLYDVTSPSPPAAPISFVTGEAGYNLSVLSDDGEISEYLLIGIFEDGNNFSIRVTNGLGAYIQANSSDYDCQYDRDVIISSTDGLSAVCSGATHTYSTVNTTGCTDYVWSLVDGGTIVGPNDEAEVVVQWDNASGGPYTLVFTPLCPDMCLSPVETNISIGDPSTQMSCVGALNISLNDYCSSEVNALTFLTNQTLPNEAYQLMITDASGKVVPNNLLTEEHLWTTVTAKVTDPCSGNSCWTTVNVEDKNAPNIQCGDISMPCYLLESYEPIVIENCHDDASYELIHETIQPLNCDQNYIKVVTRQYVATDGYGNVSEPCDQVISLERMPLDEIEYPESFLLDEMTNLICADSIYDKDGNVRTDIAGVPKLNGYPIYPVQDFYCNVGIDYEDFVVADFGCSKKIMRTWRVYEAWCTTGVLADPYVQTIEISDTEAPTVTCPESVTVSSGGIDCEGTIVLDLPTIEDDCATEFEINLTYEGGFERNLTSAPTITVSAGISKAKYYVYDLCENVDSCTVNLEILDLTNPVAVCDENTIVSLRSTGTAKAFAHTFDDGSYDDCSLFKTLVRRVDSSCDCQRPEFEDMNFLGERDGSFYYLSKFKTHGSKAFAYSSAFGGNLVKFETQEECEWVHEQTKPLIISPYYIGLSDTGHQDRFTWDDHTDPTFDKFESGSTMGAIGDNVITNEYGEWVVVDGVDVEAYYVLELTDPCGFSDEIYFCCEDSVEDQEVIFRVVDYFGRTNECEVIVEVQDKVAPKIICPDSEEISCSREISLEDLTPEFGYATATDECGAMISDTVIDMRSGCAEGDIIRRFMASDNNGSSTCDQILAIINDVGEFDNNVIWPLDFETDMGCNSDDLDPDSLAVEFSRPRFEFNSCGNLAVSMDEQRFSFAGPGSDSCLKILRRWTILDWCQHDDPGYEPLTHDQVIKVSNIVGPEILTGCDTLNINTEQCEFENVSFSASANDDCTPAEDLKARIQIDIDSDGLGTFDTIVSITNGVVSFNGLLPIGNHFALISFEDQCNNVTTCTKIINVNNITVPTAACVDGITVALEPMDLDGDGTPDTERACIFPEMIDASSTHTCGTEIFLSFSADTSDVKKIFECVDIGVQTVELWVTDAFGNTAFCSAHVDVQDNNNEDFCPRFDLALVKTLDTDVTPGPFNPGDNITYNLEVINQGNIMAFDIGLVDYIPDGLTLNDSNWTANADGTIATLNNNIVNLEDSMSINLGITFTIDNDFMGFTITNVAEISEADNDNDPNNTPLEDSDSNPDSDNDDTIGGDDITDGTDGDEDDHDPATIDVIQTFDLSLAKECSDSGPYMPGSSITYLLRITNEGTINATNVELADNIPAGLTLNDSDWTQNGNVATLNTPVPVVNAGQTVDVEITFTIDDMFMNASIVNTAQIIDPNGLLLPDEDSTPGNDDGDQSEDDEASKEIVVGQVFDLALVKLIDTDATPAPYDTGDDVTFTVTVYNQGSLDATNIQVVDYVPQGMSFDPAKNSDFNVSGSNAMATVSVDSDQSLELSITLTIRDDFAGNSIINTSEIISAFNLLGLEDQDDDLDNVNTNGSNPELGSNNDINDDREGTPGVVDNPIDEDDYDFEVVDVNCTLTPICNAIDLFEVLLDANGMGTVTADQLSTGVNASTSTCTDETVSVSIVSGSTNFTCVNIGTGNVVTLQAMDSNGNVSTNECQTSITVVDNLPPTVECQDVTVSTNSAGEPLLVESEIVTDSDDNCFVSDTIIDLSNITDFVALQCTPMMATIIVTDPSNNTGECDFLISIANEPPTANCNDFTVELDDDGMATITALQVDNNSTDDCTAQTDLVYSLNNSMFNCSSVGTQFVELTVTDEVGQSSTCTATIEVEDNVDPNAECQNITIELDANGTASITGMDINDNSNDACGIFTANPSQFDFDCMDMGANTVTLTVTDNNMNSSTCTATVTVEDNIDPTVSCNATLPVTLDSNGMATVTVDAYISASDDNCGIVSMVSDHPQAFTCDDIALSPITVEVTVTDGAGNEDTCTTQVTIDDDENPTCTLTNAVVDIDAFSMITLTELGFAADDNCASDASLETNAVITPTMFDCMALGSNTVTVTVTDGNGNTSTCEANVNVEDGGMPICNVVDITVDLDAMGNASITASDIDNGSVVGCDENPMLSLNIMDFDCTDTTGTNPVVLTITGDNMISMDCDANVTVQDVTPPMLDCVDDITLDLDANGQVNMFASVLIVSSSDNCGIASSLVNPGILTCDNIGQVTVVTVTVTDNSGLVTTCDNNVTVVDNMDPTCTIADITVAPEQVFNLTDLMFTSEDNCDDMLMAVIDTTSFDCEMLGLHTVTVTVTDDSGNTGECMAEVDVEDIEFPVCQSFANITVFLNVVGEVVITPMDVDSASFTGCSPITLSVDPALYACNDVDSPNPNVTVLTVTDAEGDSATCTTIVTVLDTISPVIMCPATDTILFLDNNGVVILDDATLNITATDGCDLDGITLDVTSLACSNKGTPTIVTATATDENDNTATCQVTVNVDDNIAPSCTLLPNLVLPPNITITEGTVLETFGDNCATASSATTITPDIFDCTELGPQVITMVVTDDCGNTGSCTADVTIEDNSMPICIAQDIEVSLSVIGNAVISAEDIDDGSTAACGNTVMLEIDQTLFNCTDIGDNIVTLTVTASGGDSASCTATVTIVDDLEPTLVCPADMSFPCGTDISNLDVFGDPTLTDNCDPNPSVSEETIFDLNVCDVGTIERIFTATDNAGNSGTCMQTVTIDEGVNPIVETDIMWPTSPIEFNQCIVDAENLDTGMPIVDTSNADCFSLSISFEDFGNSGSECFNTFTRVWTVIDSCQTNGVFTFNQFVTIDDQIGPDISGPMDMVIMLPAGICDTFLNLPATVTDCVGGVTATNNSPFANSNATADATGTYGVGETIVSITATDACSVDSVYTYSINVIDNTVNITDCAKIFSFIDASLMDIITIDQANVTFDSDCGATGVLDTSFSPTDPNLDQIIVDCSDIGVQDYTVYVYSGMMLVDSCTNLLQVADGGSFCTSPQAGNIVGDVFTEDNRMVEEVSVELIGGPFETQMTNNDGEYAFPEMVFGGTYMVKPTKDIEYLNGVSTLDLIGIQNHIIGTDKLDSPYKLIAADINRSGDITSVDLLELRKLILGIYTELPDNTSWRMVDSEFKFVDELDPFAYNIPEEYEIFNFTESMDIDFIGVKIGDVNNSAVANVKDVNIDSRSSRNFTYKVTEALYEEGSIVNLTFRSNELSDIDGLQNTIQVNSEFAEIIAFNPETKGLTNANVNSEKLDEGILNMSWYKSSNWSEGENNNLFTLVLKIKEDGYTSDMIRISDEHISAESYFDNQVGGIDLEFRSDLGSDEVLSLYQNVPNPWSDNTEIKFYMPSDENVVVNIYDVNGKLVFQQQSKAKHGVNRVVLNEADFNTGGILYYELISGGSRLINKMLLIK